MGVSVVRQRLEIRGVRLIPLVFVNLFVGACWLFCCAAHVALVLSFRIVPKAR